MHMQKERLASYLRLNAIDPLPHHVTSVTFKLIKVEFQDVVSHIPILHKVLIHFILSMTMTPLAAIAWAKWPNLFTTR